MYERSAQIYDLIYTAARFKPVADWAAEIDTIIRERNPAARALLDVACGTGHHLNYLREHYDVEGIDISAAMLEVARKRLPGVTFHHGDMRVLDLGRKFDAVTCLFSSIGYVLSSEELMSTIGRFGRHLAPGGVLVIEGWVRSPDFWRDDFRGEPEVVMSDEVDIVRLNRSWRRGRTTSIEMHHLVRTATEIEHFAETHVLYMVPPEEYVAAVHAAGLRAEVLPDYMPGRDRVVGVKPR
jgi:SAM-dependent methyltransferase